MSNDRNRALAIINAGGEEALALVRNARGYNEGEGYVSLVMPTSYRDEEKKPDAAPEIIEAALEGFLATRENRFKEHGYWVHALSHVTGELWERRMVGWIRRLNEVAFEGAIELGDANCCDRLVNDFVEYAKWDDDPVDFGLTAENLAWMDAKQASGYAMALIGASPFKSEEAAKRFKLLHKLRNSSFGGWSNEYQCDMVRVESLKACIAELAALGDDVSEFTELPSRLLRDQLVKLEREVDVVETRSWDEGTKERWRETYRKALEHTRSQLASL